MNRCAVAVGCPAARPGPAPQRRSPAERQDNSYISLGSCGHLRRVLTLTCVNGRAVSSSGSAVVHGATRQDRTTGWAVSDLCRLQRASQNGALSLRMALKDSRAKAAANGQAKATIQK